MDKYNNMKKLTILSFFIAYTLLGSSFAQAATTSSVWSPLKSAKTIKSDTHSTQFSLAEAQLKETLANEGYRAITVPSPNGDLHTFRLSDAQIMPESLAAKFPNIKAFSGVSISNPALSGRFTLTPSGMSAMFEAEVNQELRRVFVDPVRNTKNTYSSYVITPVTKQQAQLGYTKHAPKLFNVNRDLGRDRIKAQKTSEADQPQEQITYRLAMTAAGEYTEFHGGTVASAMAEIVIMVNRLNELFAVELGVQFQLIAKNDLLIFTDPATDPFNNDSDDGDINQIETDTRIGTANYDIGHIVNTNGGGLAVLGSLCWDGFKANGITGSNQPANDAFWIDFVAHEIGHQFGANHSFNGTSGSCAGGNREANAAYEVGAGTTIMSYAGICSGQNITFQVDDYYHVHSLNEMAKTIEDNLTFAPNCGVRTDQGNIQPVANAGDDKIIPASTPFVLTGGATDQNTSDTLSYSWEQYDLGTASTSQLDDETDEGSGPLFRSLPPTTSPSRFFPRKINALQRTTAYGEAMATTNRTMNFQFTVRDNQGGNASDTMQVTVVDTGAPFQVTAPTRNDVITSNPLTVTWDVAGTDQDPINCSSVNIELSNNTGGSYDVTLASGIANDGSASVNLPQTDGEQRFQNIRVMCANNVFYSTSLGVFSSNIDDTNPLRITGQNPLSTPEDVPLTLTIEDFTFSLSPSSITVLSGTNYTVINNTITPSEDYNGPLNVSVTATANSTNSEIFNANVTVDAVNDAPIANDDSATVEQDSNTNNIDVISNDTDVDMNDVISVSTATANGTGTVTLTSDTIVYTPPVGFNGIETITYSITDGTDTATGTLTVTVNAPPVNNPPVAQPDTGSTKSGNAITIAVLANDSDADNDSLSISSVSTSGSGSVSIQGNSIRYVSASDFTGNEVITYEVSDGEATTSGTLTVTVTAPQTSTQTPPANSSGSSGGSMSWFALLALVLIATGRYLALTSLNKSTKRNT